MSSVVPAAMSPSAKPTSWSSAGQPSPPTRTVVSTVVAMNSPAAETATLLPRFLWATRSVRAPTGQLARVAALLGRRALGGDGAGDLAEQLLAVEQALAARALLDGLEAGQDV